MESVASNTGNLSDTGTPIALSLTSPLTIDEIQLSGGDASVINPTNDTDHEIENFHFSPVHQIDRVP